MFFLATPHRGSNLAAILSKILLITPGARPYVADLHPNSAIIQSINEEFPHHSSDLQLHSFYENSPMSFGVKKAIVVPKDSATLGYANERTNYLDANHREVCKFGALDDPNYVAVRNALASAVIRIRSSSSLKGQERDHVHEQWLSDALEPNETSIEDYERVTSIRIAGSCEWIKERETFQKWRESNSSAIYWLTAKPGTGKSVLAGLVIDHLRELHRDCSFYFFSHGDKLKSTVGPFLKSMARQMSLMVDQASDCIVSACQKDPQIPTADYRTLWRKFYLDGLLKLKSVKPQYWVIDALDECRNPEIVPWLIKAAETGVIKIFVTSRNPFNSYEEVKPHWTGFHFDVIPQDSTDRDISLYLKKNANNIPTLDLDSDESQTNTMQLILNKSAGCFLW